MKFFTYILYSSKIGKYYIGNTQDIEKRICKHNKGYNKSTKGGIPWELVYYELYTTRVKAYKREKEIKSQKKREYIHRLIFKIMWAYLSCRYSNCG